MSSGHQSGNRASVSLEDVVQPLPLHLCTAQAKRFDLVNGTHELAVAWSDRVLPVGPNVTNNGVPPTVPGRARPLIYYDLHTVGGGLAKPLPPSSSRPAVPPTALHYGYAVPQQVA